jgi:sulfate adenylyltransferase
MYQILNELLIQDTEQRNTLLVTAADAPVITLKPRQLCDLELLINRGFYPLEGFMDESDYNSVLHNMRLSNGAVWPIPIVLDLDDISKINIGSYITLADEYGKPLALMHVSSIYQPDKMAEVNAVYKTEDHSHYGVRYILEHTGNYYIGGKVFGLNTIDRYDFRSYRLTPNNLRSFFAENNWTEVCAFQVRNPVHKAHFSMIKSVHDDYGLKVLLHPSVGVTNDGDIDYVTRVRSYIKLVDIYGKDFMKLSLLPLAMRMGGPREALLHALIRKNYGCSHFIVGRHHAEPKDYNGNDFYGAYDAQELVQTYEKEIGISIIPFKEMVYVEKKKSYLPADKVQQGEETFSISGTQFRHMITNNHDVPEWFSFPEVIHEIKKGHVKNNKNGLTIFFTGLPSSGKSTLANILYHQLEEIQDKSITLLDGDVVRNNLSKGLGFSKEDRMTNIMRIGFVASEITKHGGIALCSAIAPYDEARKINRELISKTGNYIEVYVSTPLEVCASRDVKGLYNKTKRGGIQNMTGVNDPYEVPLNPEITIDTSTCSKEEAIEKILQYLRQNSLI